MAEEALGQIVRLEPARVTEDVMGRLMREDDRQFVVVADEGEQPRGHDSRPSVGKGVGLGGAGKAAADRAAGHRIEPKLEPPAIAQHLQANGAGAEPLFESGFHVSRGRVPPLLAFSRAEQGFARREGSPLHPQQHIAGARPAAAAGLPVTTESTPGPRSTP
jgi:hypothetical protein